MSQDSARLRARREALLRRSERQRLDWDEHLQQIEAALDSVDRGLGFVQRIATPPLMFAGSLLGSLLLSRTRSRRALAASLALAGQLAIQLVRRSR